MRTWSATFLICVGFSSFAFSQEWTSEGNFSDSQNPMMQETDLGSYIFWRSEQFTSSNEKLGTVIFYGPDTADETTDFRILVKLRTEAAKKYFEKVCSKIKVGSDAKQVLGKDLFEMRAKGNDPTWIDLLRAINEAHPFSTPMIKQLKAIFSFMNNQVALAYLSCVELDGSASECLGLLQVNAEYRPPAASIPNLMRLMAILMVRGFKSVTGEKL